MSTVVTAILAIYMLVGMFILVGMGVIEALTSGWIEVIHKRGYLELSQGALYLLAVAQITIVWVMWPVVLWLAVRKRAAFVERRRVP